MRYVLIWVMALLMTMGAQAQTAKTQVSLISDASTIESGKAFYVGVRLNMPEGWHTYWMNAGDSGIPTEIDWKLPVGWKAGEIQWPIPERIEALPLVTYGYEKEVVLPVLVTPPSSLKVGSKINLEATVNWLECRETCIPGKVTVSLQMLVTQKSEPQKNETLLKLIQDSLSQTPQKTAEVRVEVDSHKKWRISVNRTGVKSVLFFPLTLGKVTLNQPFEYQIESHSVQILGSLDEKTDQLSGVLVFETDLGREIVHFTSPAHEVPVISHPEVPAQKSLIGVLLFAFVGGLILNLMPCVLPVLALKILGFVQESQGDASKAWRHGVAFTGGVLISFWILTGVLLGLRAGGEGLGWGFQLQSPGFVLAMTILFLLMTLNLFGLFEVGSSLTALENQVSGKKGWMKSFGSGVLATIVATPCSAPFMGAAVGYALGQSTGVTFSVMTMIALGVAAPYLIISLKPEWSRKIPKPGMWMVTLKQFLGFLMLGAVLWLVWVYAQLKGVEGLGSILSIVGVLSLAVWLWTQTSRLFGKIVAILLAGLVVFLGYPKNHYVKWESYSAEKVEAFRKEGKPVFINFTAAWCLSCQVNKKLVLHRSEIEKAFLEKGVILMEADWTDSDPEITKALASFDRASVPLYVLYGKNPEKPPQVLPEILTPEIVLESLRRLDQ